MKFRLRYQVLGGHTHVRVFAGKGEILGLCGTLVFRNEEWEEFLKQTGELVSKTSIEVIPEGSQS